MAGEAIDPDAVGKCKNCANVIRRGYYNLGWVHEDELVAGCSYPETEEDAHDNS